MVQQPEPVTGPASPRRPRRHRPSRTQLLVRRGIALGLLLAGLAIALWLVTLAVGGLRDEPAPKPTPVAAGPPTLKIIFPEGFTREQMAERITEVNGIAREKRNISPRLSSAAYRKATASSKIPAKFAEDDKRRPLEGFLFPAAYQFEPKTTSRQLVNRQLEAFERAWSQVDLSYAKSRKLTSYDVLIIASLIEKEVIAPEERGLVAAVIYNRLRRGMTLGIDATIRYGLDVPATESLRESHLEDPTPYNTRLHAGLTPTPIASPGLASMQAAAHPKDVDYLFFVRKPDKIHHFFTASEDEFNNYRNANGYG